jgi:hypothetical protein
MTKPLDTLMQKEMTRKEFVATLGLGMASVMGFSTIIHLLTCRSLTHRGMHATYGYGSSAYGGGGEGQPTLTRSTTA